MKIDEDAPFLLDQLEQLALKVGISVRYESLNPDMESVSSRGGLCRVKKRNLVIVDSRLSAADRCRVLIEAFGKVDLSQVFVPPLIRDLIESPGGGR